MSRRRFASGAADDPSRGAGTRARRGHAVPPVPCRSSRHVTRFGVRVGGWGALANTAACPEVCTGREAGGDPAAGLSPSPALWAGGTFLQHGHPDSSSPGFGGTGGSYGTWALPGS